LYRAPTARTRSQPLRDTGGRPEVGINVFSSGTDTVEAGVGIEVPPTSQNQIPPTAMPENLPLNYQQPTTTPNTKPNEKLTTATNPTLKVMSSNFAPNDNSSNFTIAWHAVTDCSSLITSVPAVNLHSLIPLHILV